LEATIGTVARLFGQLDMLEPEYSRISRAVKELGKGRGPLWRGA